MFLHLHVFVVRLKLVICQFASESTRKCCNADERNKKTKNILSTVDTYIIAEQLIAKMVYTIV